ncbi:ANTAR domain-containing protein [Streptomyces gilvus]|uniref:ANTAR domain-containing protein n=1 Tax=Streptomyces gilvus TaxID=2920937 RepID=UPI001F0E0509|nr:ANTAR domain-containing protein [Streptomyces sp. CME 23]MCH5677001.1 ANTAR domain-containing protein [Streptomyces sp. CME 23]
MAPPDDAVDKIAALQEEVDQLRQALVSHAAVDQAIGVLMAAARLRSQEGWEVLQFVSQHTNIKLREIAQHVLRWAEDGELPDAVRTTLHTAVIRTRRQRLRSASRSDQGGRAGQQRRRSAYDSRMDGSVWSGETAEICDWGG